MDFSYIYYNNFYMYSLYLYVENIKLKVFNWQDDSISENDLAQSTKRNGNDHF